MRRGLSEGRRGVGGKRNGKGEAGQGTRARLFIVILLLVVGRLGFESVSPKP